MRPLLASTTIAAYFGDVFTVVGDGTSSVLVVEHAASSMDRANAIAALWNEPANDWTIARKDNNPFGMLAAAIPPRRSGKNLD
jgi:hypothetical protein